MLTRDDTNRRILLVMALQIQLLLLIQLSCVDGGSDIGITLTEHCQCGLVDVVINKHNGLLGLFDEVRNLYVSIEDLAIVEDAFYWGEGRTDEEIYLAF